MKAANFAGLLYWARSAVNAGAWLPCMLSLDGGQVELVSERGVELRSPASDLVVEITGLSNLMVIATGATLCSPPSGGRQLHSRCPRCRRDCVQCLPRGTPWLPQGVFDRSCRP